jgi:hypothetical protein
MSYSQENYKTLLWIIEERKSLQLPKKLPTEDKQKADIIDLLRKNCIYKLYATFMGLYFNNVYNIQSIVRQFCILFLP